MRVAVYYQSGKIDEFNTETFCSNEPFKHEAARGCNITTEFQLRLDLLSTEGLRLDVFWYNTVIDGATTKTSLPGEDRAIYHAGREPGRIVRLVSPKELYDIAKIVVDGEMVVWRQGTELINGIKFSAMELLCFTDRSSTSINSKVCGIFDYLKNANPELPDEAITQLFGYSYRAYLQILHDEGANLPDGGEEPQATEPASFDAAPPPLHIEDEGDPRHSDAVLQDDLSILLNKLGETSL